MKFGLYYRGKLRANGSIKEKQRLRREFHPQLKDLWDRSPLKDCAKKFLDPEYELTVVKEINGWQFSSVVNKTHDLIAEVDITILRPEEPGSLITQGGDIDNLLKTLLDSLRIPDKNQIPGDDCLKNSERPLHCLLEDDNLITTLNVTMDRLLGSTDQSEVLAIICVDVSAVRGTFQNLGLSL